MRKIGRVSELVQSIVPAANDVEDHITRQHVSKEVQAIISPGKLRSIEKDLKNGDGKAAAAKFSDLNDALEGLERRMDKKKRR